jgi:hypothetical protein
MTSPEDRETYLCLLDLTELDSQSSSVLLGHYEVKYFRAEELMGLLRGSDDPPPLREERARIESYSMYPWAIHREVPNNDPCFAGLGPRASQAHLHAQHVWARCWYPFDDLTETLNLLKPASIPLRPIQFYLRPLGHTQVREQIARVIHGEPTFAQNQAGKDMPIAGYVIECSDGPAYLELEKQLQGVRKPSSDVPSVDHISSAMQFFKIADRNFFPMCYYEEACTLLLLYDAVVEALLVCEKENCVEKMLTSRVPKAIGRSDSDTMGFLRKMFWLRSKLTHGARPIDDIVMHLGDWANKEVCDAARKKTIPAGGYESLFMIPGWSPCPFLTNARELARQCIRFFVVQWCEGSDKDAVLRRLDKK